MMRARVSGTTDHVPASVTPSTTHEIGVSFISGSAPFVSGHGRASDDADEPGRIMMLASTWRAPILGPSIRGAAPTKAKMAAWSCKEQKTD